MSTFSDRWFFYIFFVILGLVIYYGWIALRSKPKKPKKSCKEKEWERRMKKHRTRSGTIQPLKHEYEARGEVPD
ncbi:MAG: hypothetical protein ACFFAX_13900 [Promethearchaeota archaeon]